MKSRINRIPGAVILIIVLLLPSSCLKSIVTGVCTGYSSYYNHTYCKDGWTREECEEWDDLQVNGVDWYFYPGQTCDGRGTPATP
jgi:hypothetical protein